jgi:predicted nucleotidyltransferase
MSIGSALFAPAQSKVLAWLYGDPARAFHVNELLRLTGLGSASLQRELRRLEAAGLIVSQQVGNLRRIRANEKNPVHPELVSLIRKTLGVDAVIHAALLPFEDRIRLALLYGSVARDTDQAASDIDVMVVTDELGVGDLLPALLDAERRLGRRIEPNCYTLKAFRERTADPHSFVSQVLRNPVRVLMGKVDGLVTA